MRTRSPYTLATMIFLASFFLRWELISKGPFHGDCMSLVMQAQQTAATGTVHYLHSHGFPLAAILNGFFVWTFQSLGLSDPVFAVNMMSVVFSSLTVLVFFLLTRIWFNENTAFFAAALFSATPIFLANSVYGNTHMPALFFALLGIYGIWKGYLPKQTHRSLILPAIFLGFGIAARAQDAFFFLPVVAALLCVHPSVKDSRFRKKLGAIVLFTGTAMLTAGLFYAPLIQQDFLIKSQRGHNLIHFLDSELLAHIATDFWIFLPLCFKFISSTITPAGVLLCISGLFFRSKKNGAMTLSFC
ncbi:MAG TPA: glycosyltransferase family 39 protein [Candidatus Omnitrophota bacterium]|nr:glycosyltransferase family 39 protein [Candidatus Omnitrophota bacterium]